MASKKIRKYAVDSSVAVKWFVDEKGSDSARFLEAEFAEGNLELMAPTLLKYEVASALRWHPLAHLKPSEIAGALEVIDRYHFLFEPTPQAWNHAIELSNAAKISVYDAVYVAFAHAIDSHLVTTDEKLIKSLPLSERDIILHLGELEK